MGPDTLVNAALLSQSLAAVAYSVLLAVLLVPGAERQPGDPRAHRLFVTAVGLSAAWGWTGVGALVGDVAGLAIVASGLDLARYGCWFAFSLALLRGTLGRAAPRAWRNLRMATAVALVLGTIAFVLSQLALGARLFPDGWPLVSLVLPALGMLLVEQLYRSAPDDSRWHVKPLCFGLASIFLYDIYLQSNVLLFGHFDETSLVARSAVNALPAPLFYVASRRQGEWQTPMQLSRHAVMHTATLMLAGLYLLGISAIGYYIRYFGGDWGRALALTVLWGALIFLALLVFSGTMRARARVFIGKHFFRYRYDYREEWLRLTGLLSVKEAPEEIGASVIKGLADLLHCRGGELWLADQDGRAFVQAARRNSGAREERIDRDSPFAKNLRDREWIIDLNELRGAPASSSEVEAPEWLVEDASSWLVIPLIVGERLTGLVILAQSNSGLRLNWEARDLLKTASRQAAGFLELMRATEALLEARKFDAFNRMSAFVVHDLKNIVAQLSLMMQNAKRLKDNPEFQEDMLVTVENSLEKMRRLMLQLREGATPVGVSAGVRLVPLVNRIEAAARARGRALEVTVEGDVVTRGHEERLQRVIGHLVDNALDATADGGTVQVGLRRSGSQAEVRVSDTGRGMSEEFVRTRLFKPFQSTKGSGMGIGAYESFEYVRELGGQITVDSEEGRGTTITVALPLLDVRHESDLGMRAA